MCAQKVSSLTRLVGVCGAGQLRVARITRSEGPVTNRCPTTAAWGCNNQAVNVQPVNIAMSDVDLGPCRAKVYDRGADRWAIVLPGAMYLPDAPLLWFSREAALEAGYNVLAVWDTFDRSGDPLTWVEERLQAALDHVPDEAPMLIAKSLTTMASQLAARRGLRAVWITPLVAAEHPAAEMVMAGLMAASAPSLLIGGGADSSWDATVAGAVPRGRVLEIADADHVLQVPGDVGRSLDALRTVSVSVEEFARGESA